MRDVYLEGGCLKEASTGEQICCYRHLRCACFSTCSAYSEQEIILGGRGGLMVVCRAMAGSEGYIGRLPRRDVQVRS